MFDSPKSIRGRHRFYFSPGAVRIAKVLIKSYAGTRCPVSPDASLGLLVGNAGWREMFFP